VLSWLGLALLAAAVGLAGHWWSNRYDAIGRRRPVPWVSMLLLVVLAAGAVAPGVLRVREERRLAQAASVVVGAKVRVHCESFGRALVDATAELGSVRIDSDGVPEHATSIKRDQCRDLARYLRSDKREPSMDQVVALHVLTHESMHMAGITDEARAECAAMQRDEHMAELLGAHPAEARALADRYWRTDYPNMPDGYRSADCHAGGPMDEHLGNGPWAHG
jgi:hypothetical protein